LEALREEGAKKGPEKVGSRPGKKPHLAMGRTSTFFELVALNESLDLKPNYARVAD
jgi:hypothetical protein